MLINKLKWKRKIFNRRWTWRWSRDSTWRWCCMSCGSSTRCGTWPRGLRFPADLFRTSSPPLPALLPVCCVSVRWVFHGHTGDALSLLLHQTDIGALHPAYVSVRGVFRGHTDPVCCLYLQRDSCFVFCVLRFCQVSFSWPHWSWLVSFITVNRHSCFSSHKQRFCWGFVLSLATLTMYVVCSYKEVHACLLCAVFPSGEFFVATLVMPCLFYCIKQTLMFGWVLLYVHRNRRLIRDGEPRTATSTFTQLLSSAYWWYVLSLI